jgi:hypothetical protein
MHSDTQGIITISLRNGEPHVSSARRGPLPSIFQVNVEACLEALRVDGGRRISLYHDGARYCINQHPTKDRPTCKDCIVSMMNNRTTAYECRKDMSDVENVERAGIYVEDVDMLPQMADDNNFCRQLISYRSLEKHGV